MVKMVILHGNAAGQVVEMYDAEAQSAGSFGYAKKYVEPEPPEPPVIEPEPEAEPEPELASARRRREPEPPPAHRRRGR